MTTITTLSAVAFATPALSSSRERLVRAADNLWRVHGAGMRILGHLRLTVTPAGVRYRAERLHAASGIFRLVGEFWSPDDAVAALRH